MLAASLATLAAAAKPGAGITKEPFGQARGQPVELHTLTNNKGMVVKITNYGGIITELHVPDRNGKMGDVVLGLDTVADYIKPSPYFGTIIGRYGNRIAAGKFTLDGVEYTLATNNDKNHLHGGNMGFNKMVWAARPVEKAGASALVLTRVSKDGEEGYPGNLQVTVTYTLTDDNELIIDYHAVTDKPTPCNLTNHSFFNLSAGRQPTVDSHELVIFADNYTEVGADLIPTGRLPAVAGTPMDFTKPRRIGERVDADFEQLKHAGGYDHTWVLRKHNNVAAATPTLAATAYEPESGRVMEVLTTEPGVQFYSGNFLNGSVTGKYKINYGRRAGFCLETQHFPDSPNQPSFPSTILRPGQAYQTQTIYKFSVK
jgi:aldose 1-epimerase